MPYKGNSVTEINSPCDACRRKIYNIHTNNKIDFVSELSELSD